MQAGTGTVRLQQKLLTSGKFLAVTRLHYLRISALPRVETGELEGMRTG